MANIHVTTLSEGFYRLVLHFPIANTNNPAGTNWRTAMVNSGEAKPSVLPVGTGAGQITSAENTSITTGAVAELVIAWAVPLGANGLELTGQELLDRATDVYTDRTTKRLAELQALLKQFGRTI